MSPGLAPREARRPLAAALLLLVLSAVACLHRPAAPSALPLDQAFVLAPGQTVTVGSERLQVSFDRVAQDSRCPSGVNCIWEGDAVVRVGVALPVRPGAVLELHTSGRFATAASYQGYRVRLESVAPAPAAGAPVVPAQYRIGLVVDRSGP